MSIQSIIIGIILSAILMAGAYIGLNNVLNNGKASNALNEFDNIVKSVVAYKSDSPKIGTYYGIDTNKLNFDVVNSDTGNTGEVLKASDSGADNDGDGTNDGQVTLNDVNGGTTFTKIVKVKDDNSGEANVNLDEYVYAFQSVPGMFAQVKQVEGNDEEARIHIEQGYVSADGEAFVPAAIRSKIETKLAGFVQDPTKVQSGSSSNDGVLNVILDAKKY